MPAYEVEYIQEFEDINGSRAQMRFRDYADDTNTMADLVTTANAIGAAIGAPGHLSNAKVVRVGVSFLVLRAQITAAPLPLDAPFSSVSDKARILLANSRGGQMICSIPAPIEAVFHAPPADNTVDPTQVAMAAFIAAVEAQTRVLPDIAPNDNLGRPNLYVSGSRMRTGHPR